MLLFTGHTVLMPTIEPDGKDAGDCTGEHYEKMMRNPEIGVSINGEIHNNWINTMEPDPWRWVSIVSPVVPGGEIKECCQALKFE